jgi:hypothetical protein
MKNKLFALSFTLLFLTISCQKENKTPSITIIGNGETSGVVYSLTKKYYPTCENLVLEEEASTMLQAYWKETPISMAEVNPIFLDALYNASSTEKIAILVSGVETQTPHYEYYSYEETLIQKWKETLDLNKTYFCFIANRTFYDGVHGENMPNGFRNYLRDDIFISIAKEENSNTKPCLLLLDKAILNTKGVMNLERVIMENNLRGTPAGVGVKIPTGS